MYRPERGSSEPTPNELGGASPGRVARRLWRSTRPGFLPASILPVLLGTILGARESVAPDVFSALLAMVAVTCVHAAANVLNDVCDEATDAINSSRIHPYTGGSRFIQNHVMTRQALGRWGSGLLLGGLLAGALLILHAGTGVLMFGLPGVMLATLYSLPPVKLSHRGWGELAVAVSFGVLPVTGAAWLQTGQLTLESFAISLPVSLWAMAILLVNEIPDREADREAGKYTLAVRLELAGLRRLYLLLQLSALAMLVVYIGLGWLPSAAFAVLLLLLPAVKAANGLADAGNMARLRSSIRLTLLIHAAGVVWLCICLGGMV